MTGLLHASQENMFSVQRYHKHRSYFLNASQENLCSGAALQSMQEELRCSWSQYHKLH